MTAVKYKFNIGVYGQDWEGLIPKQFIRGSFVENQRLPSFYKGAEIILNDHWPDMRDKGFLSNRLFDAAAAGAFIISDKVQGLESIFTDNL